MFPNRINIREGVDRNWLPHPRCSRRRSSGCGRHPGLNWGCANLPLFDSASSFYCECRASCTINVFSRNRCYQASPRCTVGEQDQVYFDVGYHGVSGSWNPVTEHHARCRQNCGPYRMVLPVRDCVRLGPPGRDRIDGWARV